jgi:hypothetical protein
MIKSGSPKKLWGDCLVLESSLDETLQMIFTCCMVKCLKPSFLVKLLILPTFLSLGSMSGSSFEIVLSSSQMIVLFWEDISVQVLMLDQRSPQKSLNKMVR